MYVVFDTNALFGDWRLESSSLHGIVSAAGRLDLHLRIPEIAGLEMVNHFREKLQEQVTKWEAAQRGVSRILGQATPSPAKLDIDKECDTYAKDFASVLKKNGIELLPLPEVSHEDLVRRALQRRKPFKGGDKYKDAGYRDCLLWHSILDLLESDAEEAVVLVTNNSKDFGKEAPSPDLQQDLRGIGREHDVAIFPSIRDLFHERVQPDLKVLEDLLAQLKDGSSVEFDLKAWADEDLRAEVEKKLSSHPAVDGLPSGLASVFNGLDSFIGVDVRNVVALDGAEVLVEGSADWNASISLVLDPSDIYPTRAVGLTVENYNDDTVTLQATWEGDLKVDFGVVFNRKLKHVGRPELYTIKNTEGSAYEGPEPETDEEAA